MLGYPRRRGQRLLGVGRQSGAKVVVDNTWLTPRLLRPLSLGADIVLHSATKYMQAVEYTRTCLGTVLAPQNAFLLHPGFKTLPLRIERHCADAMHVAHF